MVYLAGDNNLSEDMVSTIRDIKRAVCASIKPKEFETSDRIKIAITAQYDCGHPSIPTKRFDFTKKFPEVEETEIDETLPIGRSIEEFVKWSVNGDGKNFNGHKAEKYMLILSGHGDGFQGKTLLIDENPFGVITVQQLKDTIENINDFLQTPTGEDTHLSILGFDSCAMNSLEVLYELRQVCDIWLSSQGNIPNSGWEYENSVCELFKLGADLPKPTAVVKTFIKNFKEFNKDFQRAGRSIDLSSCFLKTPEKTTEFKGIKNVAKEVNNLASALIFYFDEDSKKQFSILTLNTINRLILQSHWECQTFMADQSIDIKDFCDRIIKNSEIVLEEINIISDKKPNAETRELIMVLEEKLIPQCRKTKRAVTDSVIFGAFSGADYQFAKGISLFFPWSFLSYSMTFPTYKELNFNKDFPNWNKFLKIYLEATMRPSDQPPFTEKNNFPVSKNFEEYLKFFGRVKNFPMNFDIEGDFE